VPGKVLARKRTAPNSNVREFQVDRKCETYNLVKVLLVLAAGERVDDDDRADNDGEREEPSRDDFRPCSGVSTSTSSKEWQVLPAFNGIAAIASG
jgi:hypothetical protein